MCCLTWFCDCIYATRCFWFKLYTPALLADLALTIYLVYQLYNLDVYACCVDNKSSLQNEYCAYSNIGGASNVGVLDTGFCYRLDDTSIDCAGNLTFCGESIGVNVTELCSESILNQVANTSVEWLIIILIVKIVGILFSLFLEFKSVCLDKKSEGSDEAESSKNCCREYSQKCFVNLSILLLRAFFLVFGTAITFIALWLLEYADSVSFSTCRTLDSTMKSDCYALEGHCTNGNDQNYYNVVFQNLDLIGPYWADLASSILSSIIWIARISVIRYYANTSQLVSV